MTKLEVTTEEDGDLIISGATIFPAVSLEAQKLLAMASVTTIHRNSNQDVKRTPVSIVAVVDKSGSMNGDKIYNLKQTLKFLVTELTNDDQFGIVEYDSHVNTTFPLTAMCERAKEKALRVIYSIRTGTTTNLSGGLEEGLKLITTNEDTRISSVLMMTDGLANLGILSSSGIISLIRDLQREGYGRCTINTFGFGSDHDAGLLREISDAGEGMYYYIESPDSIAPSFGDCIGGLLSSIAQNIELTIEAKGKSCVKDILTKKKVCEVVPKKKFRISLGDIQDGESRDIPFTVDMEGLSAAAEQYPLVKLTLSYLNLRTETLEESSCIVSIDRVPSDLLTAEQKKVNENVDAERNRYLTAVATEEAAKLADKGDLKSARKVIQTNQGIVFTSPSANNPVCATYLKELQNAEKNLRSEISYRSNGQFLMHTSAKSFHCQRSSNQREFETPARKFMKERFRSKIHSKPQCWEAVWKN